jgi:hypothetical protein
VPQEVAPEHPVGDRVVSDVLCKVAEGLMKLFGQNRDLRLETVRMVRVVPDHVDVVFPLLNSAVLATLQLAPHRAEVHRVVDDMTIGGDVVAIRVNRLRKHGRNAKGFKVVENVKTPRTLKWTQRHWRRRSIN